MPVSKRVQVRNHSYENDFDLHENETACRTHFYMTQWLSRQSDGRSNPKVVGSIPTEVK